MNYNLSPSLQQAGVVRIASLLFNDCDIQSILRSEKISYRESELLEMQTEKSLSSLLPPILRREVTQVIRLMQVEVKSWVADHEFLLDPICTTCCGENYHKQFLKHVGGCFLTYLSWKTDGTINRIRTARKIIANENMHPWYRFAVACIYFLEDEVLALWERCKEDQTDILSNIAVRFWVEWLKKRDTIHWSEMIDEYFRNQLPLRGDIPLRISSFYHLLSSESKDFTKLFAFTKLHADDFRTCVNKMDETERVQVFRSNAALALEKCFEWPFRPLFKNMAKEAIEYLTMNELGNVLCFVLQKYSLGEGGDIDAFETLWEMSPPVVRNEVSQIGMLAFFSEGESTPPIFKEICRKYLY